MSKTKYVDIMIQPIPKKNVADYRKLTKKIGEILVKNGALASRDYVAEDVNATKVYFPKAVKVKKGEVLIYAIAEFKSKAHRTQVFNKMSKDKNLAKIDMNPSYIHPTRGVMGGFKLLVEVE